MRSEDNKADWCGTKKYITQEAVGKVQNQYQRGAVHLKPNLHWFAYNSVTDFQYIIPWYNFIFIHTITSLKARPRYTRKLVA